MSLILVAYASKHGATQEIAEAIADELRQADHDIDCIPAGHVRDLEPYQAVVIGSAVS
jgi:menaquinone-dependent protoporphyrinogen oxidase